MWTPAPRPALYRPTAQRISEKLRGRLQKKLQARGSVGSTSGAASFVLLIALESCGFAQEAVQKHIPAALKASKKWCFQHCKHAAKYAQTAAKATPKEKCLPQKFGSSWEGT